MYILFDIGKTNMRVAASHDCRELAGEPVKAEVPDNYEAALETLHGLAREVCGDEPITVAAGGIGGPLDRQKQRLINIPDANKQDWIGKPLKDDVADALGGRVLLENDSAIVGLGEMHFGAGISDGIGAYMTVSTGVGGARIVDGHIDVSAMGFEPGHQILDVDHTACPTCRSCTLEDTVSGTATEHRYGKPPYEITDDDAWDEIARWLACGLATTIVHWSPEVVVLGGSMVTKSPGISTERVQHYLRETLTIFPPEAHPALRTGGCGDYGGVWGAMAHIRNNADV